MQQQDTPSRLVWLDIAKGIAILLVVIGHAWRGVHSAGIVPQNIFVAVDSRIYAFHMPAFFIISGLFYVAVATRFDFLPYIRRLVVRLIWPMVLWTYVFLGMKYAAGTMSNSPIGLSEVFRSPFPGQAHFWFLWALFLMSVALWPLGRSARGGQAPVGAMLLCAALIVVVYFIPLPAQISYWIGSAVAHVPFFFVGIWLTRSDVLSHITLAHGIAAAVAFAVILTAWPQIGGVALQTLTTFTLSVFFLIAAAGLFGGRRVPGHALLRILGENTLVIYVAHTIFSAASREVLFVLGFADLSLHMIVGVLAGIVGPLVLLELAKRTGTRRLIGV